METNKYKLWKKCLEEIIDDYCLNSGNLPIKTTDIIYWLRRQCYSCSGEENINTTKKCLHPDTIVFDEMETDINNAYNNSFIYKYIKINKEQV